MATFAVPEGREVHRLDVYLAPDGQLTDVRLGVTDEWQL